MRLGARLRFVRSKQPAQQPLLLPQTPAYELPFFGNGQRRWSAAPAIFGKGS